MSANAWLRKLTDDTLDRRAASVHALSERFGLVESDENAADAADEKIDEQKTQAVPPSALDMGNRGGEIMPERPDPNRALRKAYYRIKYGGWG